MMNCPSCGRRSRPGLVCSECSGPLAVAELDCFTALGLPRRPLIDSAALEQRYHDLSRRIHPDRFVGKSPAVRKASLHDTAILTRSYRTLRDPVSRGTYWLRLNGEELNRNNNQVPAELAELVFGVQEEISDFRQARTEGHSIRASLDSLSRSVESIKALYNSAQEDLEANFARWDGGELGQDDRRALLNGLKATLSRIAYLRTLIRDAERELEQAA